MSFRVFGSEEMERIWIIAKYCIFASRLSVRETDHEVNNLCSVLNLSNPVAATNSLTEEFIIPF